MAAKSQGSYAFALPAGLTTPCCPRDAARFATRRTARRFPGTAIPLTLHGALVADGYGDCEADVVARVRKIVGGEASVGVLLDPHCDLPDGLVDAADAIVLFKEYPHADIEKRADELARLVLDLEFVTAFGVDVRQPQLLVVKSTNHFHAAFAPIAAEVIDMSAPGTLNSDPRMIPYQHGDTRKYLWTNDS